MILSLKKNYKPLSPRSGFTLIELVVVIAIVVIMTSVAMANLPAFRSKTELDLVSQEVAITIRQAQVYGVNSKAVLGGGSLQFTPYGMNFSTKNGLNDTFTLFSDNNENGILDGSNCGGANECRERYNFKGGIKILSIESEGCTAAGAGVCPTFGSDNSFNVTFKQPNLEAIFYSKDSNGGQQFFNRNVRITIGKEPIANPANLRDIYIYTTGFIYVAKR